MPGFDLNDPKIKVRMIGKNRLAFSFLTLMPIVPGHALICPIRVVESCEQLTHEEWRDILALKYQVCKALKNVYNAEGFNFAWNRGENAGQTVPHFHLHVVPRKEGDTGIVQYEPRVFLYRPGSRAVSPLEELQQTAALIRMETVRFQKASPEYYEQVLQWLAEPHVKEFWDNSPEHKKDILIFMQGRKEPSPYWEGIFDYWIGFVNDEPYCLLMTSEILPTQPDLIDLWKTHLSKTGRTFSIDFMIGNRNYLDQGLGGSTLEAFTRFLHKQDPSIDTFFIDPAETNPRAKHVYEKGGFHSVGIFLRDVDGKKNVRHSLMIKKLDSHG